MKAILASVIVAFGGFIADAHAFEASQVRVVNVESFNFAGHLWVQISGNNSCADPHPYFIIQRWDNATEPQSTDRKLMYQLVMTALAAGKNIRIVGATCYLNAYLFADQVTVYD